MPRKGSVRPRIILPDPVYNNQLVGKLINKVIIDGKKSVAQRQIYDAFKLIEEKAKKNPLDVFLLALDNIKPELEIRPRRIGGAAYQVPMPVKSRRKESLAIRWLVNEARKRPNVSYHSFAEKLAAEIIDASNNTGGAIAKKQEVERAAESNRAFAHLRW